MRRLDGRLKIGAHDDPAEREADRLADRIGSREAGRGRAGHLAPAGGGAAGPLGSALGSGTPLDPAVRADMEPRLGRDLGGVRLHTGAAAADLAASTGALAFTLGNDIVFGAGAFRPEEAAGGKLLAHELAHVALDGGSDTIRRQVPPGAQPVDPPPAAIVPDGTAVLGVGQLTETEFETELRAALNQAGQAALATCLPASGAGPATGLGDFYVDALVRQARDGHRTIEALVAEDAGISALNAQGYIDRLVALVPQRMVEARTTLQNMVNAPPATGSDVDTAGGAPAPVPDGGMDAGAGPTDAGPQDASVPRPGGIADSFNPQNGQDIRNDFPEVAPTLASALVTIPNTIWGLLRATLQGTIFHAIISAGYLTGNPPPAHPQALINRGGGALGRRRTDLRDPATNAVIEIKPFGTVGGAAQLAAYVATLGPPWHEARDVPPEAWPVTGTEALYSLQLFDINFTLAAWNEFASEPGMLYYELRETAGAPVYVPIWSPSPERKYQFTFPQISLQLPAIPPEVAIALMQGVTYAAVGAMMLYFLFALAAA